MKKVTTKVITISSQLLVAIVFLLLLFPSKESSNSEVVTVNNNNFDKMAESTSILFVNENINLEEDDTTVSLLIEEKEESSEEEEVLVAESEPENVTNVTSLESEVIDTYVGTLTAYAGDCPGCSGFTSTGVDIRDNMYYEDSEYGTVRILAADPSIPFYSIFRVSDVSGMDPFIAIVLDRGGAVGFGRSTLFDLAFSGSESDITFNTSHNVKFELLRSGK